MRTVRVQDRSLPGLLKEDRSLPGLLKEDRSLPGLLKEDCQLSARKRRSRSRSVLRETLLTAGSVEEEDNDQDREQEIRF